MDHVIQDSTPEKECDHPNITFWHKKAFLLERTRRRVSKKLCTGTGRDRKNNVTFWFLQHEDGSVLSKSHISDMQGKARQCWAKLSKKYGPLGLPWSSVHPMWQLEFCIALERHYPLLRLCDNHYKAKVFTHEAYTHWFKANYPPSQDAKTDSPSKRSPSNSCVVLHMALRRSQNGCDNMEVDDNGQQWVDWEGIDNEDDNNAIVDNNPDHIVPLATGHALTTPLELFTTTSAPTAPISALQAAHGRLSRARSGVMRIKK
ncbi:hypothetical protein EI94DRAFT_1700763 [Lactarius quietus]|nr:hypothetical protein EI94DRAFT_1700763 [Lactarius quietus]